MPIMCFFCAHGNSQGHAHAYSHGHARDYVHGHVYYWQTCLRITLVLDHPLPACQLPSDIEHNWITIHPTRDWLLYFLWWKTQAFAPFWLLWQGHVDVKEEGLAEMNKRRRGSKASGRASKLPVPTGCLLNWIMNDDKKNKNNNKASGRASKLPVPTGWSLTLPAQFMRNVGKRGKC